MPAEPTTTPATAAPAAVEPSDRRPADVSPLAAVIGIALLGGMLLIGVLIGRESGSDEPAPAPVVQVGEATSGEATTPATPPTPESPPAGDDAAGAITSEWPAGTDGFTVQISSTPKAEATPEGIESSKQGAIDQGAIDAAVLDSDLYSSLPPGQYVIYAGVYTDRKSAEAGLKGLGKNFAAATVIEVSNGGRSAAGEAPALPDDELSPEVGGGEK